MTTKEKDYTKTFRPDGLPTLIGSIPTSGHQEALDLIFSHTPAIPLWPQLPGNPLEGMLSQFIEGFPGIIEKDDRTYFDSESPGFEQEHLAFFEDYLEVSEDTSLLEGSRFQVSRERANGLYLLLEAAKEKKNIAALKGQITGPFTVLTGLKDQNNKDAYYDPTLREIVLKGLAMKAAWQVRLLGKLNRPVILFMDEPALAGLGSSSFISISREDIAADQTEIINSIHQAGGLAGVHVCANTDWPLLLSLDYDIINFDAFSFFDRFVSSLNEINSFLDRGGIIAWGIVPTSDEEDIGSQDCKALASLWENHASALVNDKRDMKDLLRQSLITPSCGTGSLSPENACKVLELTRDVSAILRDNYM
ncbi:MAG: hypothetical protein ACLFV2_08005 [Desulfurivibrionaceae bacterium]